MLIFILNHFYIQADGLFPEGISRDLWYSLSDEIKIEILMTSTLTPKKKQMSRVLRFFLDIKSNDIDYDAAMTAVSIVSALLISIPIALLSVFNDSWYQETVDAIENCPVNSTLIYIGSNMTNIII